MGPRSTPSASGSENTGDDIPNGTSGTDKAKRIAKGVNDASDAFDDDLDGDGNADVMDPINATSGSDAVLFSENVQGVKLLSAKTSSNTGEHTRINKPTNGTFALSNVIIGTVTLTGAITGITDDGDMANVNVGTDRYIATLNSGDFARPSGFRALAGASQ